MTGEPTVHVVVGVAKDGTIGADGRVPWDYEEDLRQYRERVSGEPLVVGRRTFERMEPIPDSANLVLTRSPAREPASNVEYVDSPARAVEVADERDAETLYVIGGQAVYRLFLPYASRASVSELPEDVTGDRFFPYLGHGWTELERVEYDEFEVVEYENDDPQPLSALLEE